MDFVFLSETESISVTLYGKNLSFKSLAHSLSLEVVNTFGSSNFVPLYPFLRLSY